MKENLSHTETILVSVFRNLHYCLKGRPRSDQPRVPWPGIDRGFS